ncbi:MULTISPECIES: DUF3786 domain-containing protein [Desulfobacula]|uniref:DUF3786 domain-containing protein n=2 Tax=Desulfobacula TaxID=28222 RepID=K0NCP8_DESTT|nr:MULTISPECIES: DUF3786 domain-containing protein [Desulfobacula]CCK78460.1 uncharacterized protein TOL2_C02900 [Desulfobacula toluolica Tol2]SDU53211.1 protein of unknown function [Desulfobacula phenolica]
MPTGACGINCDVCRLNLLGLCTSCGSGKSDEARLKLETQKRLFNDTCPILSCVVMNNKDYCLRDCNQFPCENYLQNPYPFSGAYLQMQKRRREHPLLSTDPLGNQVQIPEEYWDEVLKRDLNLVCSYSLAQTDCQGNLVFQFLNEKIVLDLKNKEIKKRTEQEDIPIDCELLGLISLTYFKTVDRLYPLGKTMISSKDMKQGLYFTGKNRLKKEPVLRKFKDDHEEFIQSAAKLGGKPMDMADAACVLYPFPRVPVYYLLWNSSDQYESCISILFDRSIEAVFPPPIIWGLVNLVNSYLLTC